MTSSIPTQGQDRRTLEVGGIQVTALLDGIADIDPIAEAFPGAPPAELLAGRERYPGVYGENDAWRIYIRAWLIRAQGSLILVDTGIGVEGAPGPGWFGANGDLMPQLHAEGIRPGDIDQVIITHVHDDHVGGTVTSRGEPAFPAARYVVQTADLAWLRDSAAGGGDELEFWDTLLKPLVDKGVVQEVDGTAELASGVEVQLFPGHTPGHQVVRIASEGHHMVISGDALTHPMQLSHPDWTHMSDDDPAVAAASRRRLIAGFSSQPDMVLAPTHFTEPFGKLTFEPGDQVGWSAI